MILIFFSAGEFGSVYKGVFTTNEGMEIKVAVKTLRGVCTKTQILCQSSALLFLICVTLLCPIHPVGFYCHEDLHEFLREAEIMQSFNHENVVGLLGKIPYSILASLTLQCDCDNLILKTCVLCCLQNSTICCMVATH